nr:hypothetical protein Itr_chr09CG16550 [Ipomoea trifida]
MYLTLRLYELPATLRLCNRRPCGCETDDLTAVRTSTLRRGARVLLAAHSLSHSPRTAAHFFFLLPLVSSLPSPPAARSSISGGEAVAVDGPPVSSLLSVSRRRLQIGVAGSDDGGMTPAAWQLRGPPTLPSSSPPLRNSRREAIDRRRPPMFPATLVSSRPPLSSDE